MNRQFTFLTIVFISLLKVSYGQQQKDSCLIQGYVYDSRNGDPVAFANVKFRNIQAETNLNGKFIIKSNNLLNKISKQYLYFESNNNFDNDSILLDQSVDLKNIKIFLKKSGIELRANPPVSEPEPLISPVKDSCEIHIATWFQPACRVDTCTNTIWHVDYNDKCITKVLYKIYNPTKTKVIYKSNKIWSGKTGKTFPLEFYKADYYPYEITFYRKDKKVIKKQGKVYLHVW